MTGKRQQQMVLAGLVGLMLIYAYVEFLIVPARSAMARTRAELESSRQRIRAGSCELRALAAKEKAAMAEHDLDSWAAQLLDTMPSPYRVTAPSVISGVLEEREVKVGKVSLFLLLPVRGLPDIVVASWQIQIPQAPALRFGAALADLENRFPMGQLSELFMKANSSGKAVSTSMVFQTAVPP